MIITQIIFNKPFLSLNYDIENEVLTGDNVFDVNLVDLGDEPSDNNEITIIHDENLIVSPSSFTIEFGIPQTVSVRLVDEIMIEEGAYNFTLKLTNEYATDQNVIASLVAKNDVAEPPEVMVYKIKYYILRSGYRLNIYENVPESTILVPIEVDGKVTLKYQERKDLFEPIIASSIDINLEASLDRDFSDLYSEDERKFKAEVIKDDKIVFLGFILPDGIWEDWVSDKWVLNISATDGLSGLKNISFSNENGLNFFGRMTAFQIINICLNKTGLSLRVNINCQVAYYEWVGNDILSSIYLSTERYFQNDNNTESEPMDCDSVLRSLMQIFNATLVQNEGEWYIFRSIDLQPRMLFTRYLLGWYYETNVKEFGYRLGSQINDTEFFHCTGNQKKSIAPSVQAYQISYQYGGAKNILANGGLILEGSTGINIPGWSVNTSPDGLVDRGVRIGYPYGVRSAVRPLDPLPLLLSLNQSLTVTQGAGMVLSIKYRNDGQNSLYLNFAFGVQNGGTTYWFNINTGTWQTTGVINRVDNYHQQVVGGNAINYGNLDANYSLDVISPVNGNIVIQIFRNGHGPGGLFGVHGVSLTASDRNIKSKDYTGRRKQKTSTTVKSNVTVYNGDSGSDLFVGTIFKSDSDTPTDGWNRYMMNEVGGVWVKTDYSEFKEILEINAEDNLKISPRPMTIFEGDLKGYIPYLTYFNIDGFKHFETSIGQLIDKKFQFLRYSYSFDDDVIKMTCKEYSDNFFFGEDQFKVTIKENFGNEVQVKI